MSKAIPLPLSKMEVRVLSELRGFEGGVSPTDLANRLPLARPSLYVLLRRLDQRKFVTREQVHRKGSNQLFVIYKITEAGVQARREYAELLGFKP